MARRRRGKSVSEGDTVVEVSTDKIDAEVPAPASGTVTRLLVEPDATVQVGQALAEMTSGAAPAGDGARPRPMPRQPPSKSPRPPTPATAARRRWPARGRGEGHRPRRRQGLGPRRQGDQGGRARGGRRRRRGSRRRAGRGGRGQALRGPAAMLAKAMNDSRSMPTATSFRTLPVDTLDAKRKAINGRSRSAA